MNETSIDRSSDGRWRPLTCRVAPRGSELWITPQGELDLATADMVGARLGEYFVAGFPKVVLDLSRLTFMDSTGLRMIIDAHISAATEGVTFDVTPGPPAVQRIFELTGTQSLLSPS